MRESACDCISFSAWFFVERVATIEFVLYSIQKKMQATFFFCVKKLHFISPCCLLPVAPFLSLPDALTRVFVAHGAERSSVLEPAVLSPVV